MDQKEKSKKECEDFGLNDPEALYGGTSSVKGQGGGYSEMSWNWEGRSEPYTKEELLESIRKSEEDVAAGRVKTSEEVFAELEKKYPFLCE